MKCSGLLLLVALATALVGCDTMDRDTSRDSYIDLLTQPAEGFQQASPGNRITFPRDHGSHPGYSIEWWYLTANLFDDAGRAYGAQWTLFRLAMPRPTDLPDPLADAGNPWQSSQLFMAHMAVTWPEGHAGFQRYARGGDHGGLAQAGVITQPFTARLDDWTMKSTGDDWLPLQVQARQDDMALHLLLSSDQSVVLQGQNGFSQKHENGGGSHYYSQPFLAAVGEVEIHGERFAVRGDAWLDHEWSSQLLQPDQSGWDWFALHLESGEKLMLYRLRGAGGSTNYLHGVLLGPGDRRTPLVMNQIRFRPDQWTQVAGRELPMSWKIELPEISRRMEVRALHPEQWMGVDFAYWEGVVTVVGENPGSRGHGYLEMAGYAAIPP